MINDQRKQGINRFMSLIPHCKQLNMQVESVTATHLVLSIEGEERFVGNTQEGLIHGGVLSVLMDSACGSAAVIALPQPEICPTVDLRMDHYRAAELGKKIYCRAEVTHLTRQIVFTEGLIWQDEDKPIAKGTGTFMRLGAKRTPLGFAEHILGLKKEAAV